MTRTQLFVAGSAIALGLALNATSAAAQEVCLTNPTTGAVAGTATGTVVGGGSVACGVGAQATSALSIAIGGNAAGPTTASGGQAVAIGTSAQALGFDSTALGTLASANGPAFAVAVGAQSTANGDFASAFGGFNTASGTGATALGGTSNATADGATAVGFSADATATGATAVGRDAQANGTNSLAIGRFANNATFANSVAIGNATTNTAANQVAVGGQTAGTARTVTGVAAGTLSATSWDAVNGAQLFATNQNVAAIQATDLTQNGRLTSLEGTAVLLSDRIDDVDHRASAGTAVAIALSGNAFLPDKKFNLTGNVGVYRSKVAASIQLGAMISPSAAFNAGIAKGFSHDGKVGARAGFTFGW